MDAHAMSPYGLALLAYFQGQADATLVIRRGDGVEAPLPARHFFRSRAEFTSIETTALDRCRGHVLDIGAGTGLHSLVLQERGLAVTAIDVCAQAVHIMRRRGVRDVHPADAFEYQGGPFDTLLMLGHGIGVVETLAGLDRFLAHARGLLRDGGRLLLDSLDVTRSRHPGDLAHHDASRRAGRYVGEITMRMEFRDMRGPFCGWLHVDALTLGRHAERAGWVSETIVETEGGEYLALLTPAAG
jgi:2-polyprenyl-3-methyl-5-hydroxy-6-metoxy-1,4-benzoquinol methylase